MNAPPKIRPHANPWYLYTLLYEAKETADVIKGEDLLTKENYPELSRAWSDRKSLKLENIFWLYSETERWSIVAFEDGNGGAMSQGIWAASRSWKGQVNKFSTKSLQKRTQPCWHFDFNQVRPMSDFWTTGLYGKTFMLL